MDPLTRHVIRDADGAPLAATCVDQPLSPDTAGHLAELVRVALRLEQERDPDNLMGDKQVRAINRIRKRPTPDCPQDGCIRIGGHDGRCLDVDGQALADISAPHTTGDHHSQEAS